MSAVTNSYVGFDGQSHPKEHDDPPIGKLEMEDPDGIRVTAFPAGTFEDWHNTPRRLFMVTLAGEAEIGYGDGQTRRMNPGDRHFEDDVTGQGHTFRVVSEGTRVTLIIPVK